MDGGYIDETRFLHRSSLGALADQGRRFYQSVAGQPKAMFSAGHTCRNTDDNLWRYIGSKDSCQCPLKRLRGSKDVIAELILICCPQTSHVSQGHWLHHAGDFCRSLPRGRLPQTRLLNATSHLGTLRATGAGPSTGTGAAQEDDEEPLDACHAEALRALAAGKISTSREILRQQAKSRLRAAGAADSGPSPVRYAWGSWHCNFCNGINPPEAQACEIRQQGHGGFRICRGLRMYARVYAEPEDFNTAPEWYRQQVAAERRAQARNEKRKYTRSVLDAVLQWSGWFCSGCRLWNLPDLRPSRPRPARSAVKRACRKHAAHDILHSRGPGPRLHQPGLELRPVAVL